MAENMNLFSEQDVNTGSEVLDFISDFCGHISERPGPFREDMGYWFAFMLKTAFKRGDIVCDLSGRRYCWRDVDNLIYNIWGETRASLSWVSIDRPEFWSVKNPIQFINKFVSNNPDELCSVFSNGYCWYFAHMLKHYFGRGEVCIAAPLGHMVWVDLDNTPYDIYGVNCSECDYYIPERYLGNSIEDFMHVRSLTAFATAEDVERIIEEYRADIGRSSENEEVLDFIDNFLGGRSERMDWLTDVFTHGYCYYFAHMLKTAFSRGQVCFLLNTPHVIWKDQNGCAYDIHGELVGALGPMIDEESAPQFAQFYKQLPKHSNMYKWENVQKLLKARLALIEGEGISETS